ncbi:TPA: hypothetical protein U1B28_002041 [Streptococcus suis]|uniref:hypothetical protein n=1 Tax=Streptococcus suis TaxID=1307 RepID=UPI00209BD0FA|nr:hypothetical protein [Streptococcus suis]MCO8208451.1 hypothetical protein [Streptococcus suis]HEM3490394.1 hypothetical protein [Streptococcus suis]
MKKHRPHLAKLMLFIITTIITCAMFYFMRFYAVDKYALSGLTSINWLNLFVPLFAIWIPPFLVTFLILEILSESSVPKKLSTAIALYAGGIAFTIFLLRHLLLVLTIDQFNLFATIVGFPATFFFFKVLRKLFD